MNLHTNKIRYFGTKGRYPVKELAPEYWNGCRNVYPKSKKSQLRGYIALSEGPDGKWKYHEPIKLPSTLVFKKSTGRSGPF